MNQPKPNIFQRTLAKRAEGGFTLIELLIVIIILAVLAAIVVFAVGSTGQNAAAASCQADAKSVETALEAFKANAPYKYPGADAWTGTGGIIPNYLKEEPGNSHYVINFDASGDISVNPVGYTGTYDSAHDISTYTGGLTALCSAVAS